MGNLEKQTGEFLTPKTLKDFPDIDETPPALEQSLKAEIALKCKPSADIELETVIMDLSSLNEHIYVKTWETSQNTDTQMREILWIIKPYSPYKVTW